MATSFEVIYLGTASALDPTEGWLLGSDNDAENASSLVGSTFGNTGSPLHESQQSFSPVSYSSGDNTAYDMDNYGTNDQFSIDGGSAQTFDAIVVYNATLTYTDGTTENLTAVVIQDTSGRLYLAPEITNNADQAALESKPIESLTLNSVDDNASNFAADRFAGDFKGIVDGTAGDDTMSLGYTDGDGDAITTGNDHIEAGDGNDTINSDDGDDLIYAGSGNDVINDWSGNDIVYGEAGDDVGNVAAGDDFYDMGSGDDTLNVWDNAGDNVFIGGDDTDTIDFQNWQSTEGVSLTGTGDGSGTFNLFSHNTTGEFSEFEIISGTEFDDTINMSGDTSGMSLYGEAGNDQITGGVGADTIEGGAGNDVIVGDGGVSRESLNWQDFTDTDLQNGFTTNTGNVDVTFSSPTETGITLSVNNSSTLYTGGIEDDGTGIDPNSGMQASASNSSSLGEYEWSFSKPVTNISFNVTDLDALENLQILAFDDQGNPVDIVLTPGSNVTVSDTNADGIDDFVDGGGSGSTADASNSVTVSIAGPVSHIDAIHTIDGSGNLGIVFTEMFFDAPLDEPELAYEQVGGNIVTNGDFSSGLADWTVNNPTGGQAPTDGGGFIRFNSNDESSYGDSIEQDLTTVSGDKYSVSLDLIEADGSSGDHTFQIDVLDDLGAVIATETRTVSNNSTEAVTFDFFATSSTSTLRITNTSATATVGTDGRVDNVEVLHFTEISADDVIDGGTGDDTISGGLGSDTILLSEDYGNDTISGGEDAGDTDNDVLDMSGITSGGVSVTLTGDEAGNAVLGANDAQFDEIEGFVLTDQDDTFDGSASSSSATVLAGDGDDDIVGTAAGDYIYGGAGDDTIEGGDGADTLDGGAGTGDEVSYAGSDAGVTVDLGTNSVSGGDADGDIIANFESARGSAHDDSLTGDGGNNVLSGEGGADNLVGGAGDDTLVGGSGDDTLDGGADDDTLTGGSGDDTFLYSGGDDTVFDFNTGNTGTLSDGNSGNNDFIDLSNYYDNLKELYADQADDGILNQSNTTDTAGRTVDYGDNTSFGSGSLTFTGGTGDNSFFTQENTGVICFARGTPIMTDQGEITVEDLSIGSRVLTADQGYQPICWIGCRKIAGRGKFAPIRFETGVLGNEQPLLFSPQHRVLISSKIAQRVSGDSEVLIAAKHLLDCGGVSVAAVDEVEYYHFLFQRHALVFSAGAITESLFTGPEALKAIDPEHRTEVFELFPELATKSLRFEPARPIVRGGLGRKIAFRHQKNGKELNDGYVAKLVPI